MEFSTLKICIFENKALILHPQFQSFMYKLPPEIIQMVEQRYGQPVTYPADCDNLALAMSRETRQPISRNTVKRLMGFLASDSVPRDYTLDIVAHYLGYTHWPAMESLVVLKENSGFEIDELDVLKGLAVKQKLVLKYDPERIVEAEYAGGRWLKVTSSVNSKLQAGDDVCIRTLVVGKAMIAEQVIRDGQELGSFVAGKVGGITDIII